MILGEIPTMLRCALHLELSKSQKPKSINMGRKVNTPTQPVLSQAKDKGIPATRKNASGGRY